MLVPDPKVVRKLLTRYASLRIAQAESESEAAARELEDVVYTLCVMTGTTDIHEAVARADALLLAAGRTTAAPVRPASAASVTPVADSEEEEGLRLAV